MLILLFFLEWLYLAHLCCVNTDFSRLCFSGLSFFSEAAVRWAFVMHEQELCLLFSITPPALLLFYRVQVKHKFTILQFTI